MACRGLVGDYRCDGWRKLAQRIRDRDGNRCRGCNGKEPDVSLQVHHRTYGSPGPCGNCYLTGVEKHDLITLCAECHDAITDVRRARRYRSHTIDASLISSPPAVQAPIRKKMEVITSLVTVPSIQIPLPKVKKDIPINFVDKPGPPGLVIRRRYLVGK